MLISKTVMVKWNSKTKKHYVDLGYVYTKMGDLFEVKVHDLSKGSHVAVKVQCDKCGEISEVHWQDYLKTLKEDGKSYCHDCAMKMYGGESVRISLLQKSKTFEVWCLDNNRQDVLDRWDFELNTHTPNEISYGSKTKRYLKCPKGLHASEPKSLNHFIGNHEGAVECRACNSFAQYLINLYGENGLDLYWDWEQNTISPWKIEKCAAVFVWIKCQHKDYHGSTRILVSAFNSMGVRCSYCGNSKVHILDSLGTLHPEVLSIWSNKNKKSPYQYKPHSENEVWFVCPKGKHQDYKRSADRSTISNFRCPECSKALEESSLQEKTRFYLQHLGYDVLHEDKCTLRPKNIVEHIGLKRKGILKYDNEIVVNDKHLLIEVHGIQHYEINTWHKKFAERYNTSPEYELEYQKNKDKYKKMFAISNGYLYMELPYWVFDEQNTYQYLVDQGIKSIKEMSENRLCS